MTTIQVSEGGLVQEDSPERIIWRARVARAKILGKGIEFNAADIIPGPCSSDDIEMLLVTEVESIYGQA